MVSRFGVLSTSDNFAIRRLPVGARLRFEYNAPENISGCTIALDVLLFLDPQLLGLGLNGGTYVLETDDTSLRDSDSLYIGGCSGATRPFDMEIWARY